MHKQRVILHTGSDSEVVLGDPTRLEGDATLARAIRHARAGSEIVAGDPTRLQGDQTLVRAIRHARRERRRA